MKQSISAGSPHHDQVSKLFDPSEMDGLCLGKFVPTNRVTLEESMKGRNGFLDPIRRFLSKHLYSYLAGIAAEDLVRLFKENHFVIEAPYRPRALALALASLMNSFLRWHEEQIYGPSIAKAIIQPPLFILGHWRHGTTYLNRLLALDRQFAFPNSYQVYFPHSFLLTESIGSRILARLVPQRRLMDNVRLNVSMPHEDEYALCITTLMSPYLGMVFPRSAERYERYFTFRNVSEEAIKYWKNKFTWFLKKLSWKYNRPMLLKSPTHTCRISLLLQMFPEARFVHIRRNPYTVFQSIRHWLEKAMSSYCLQRSDSKHLELRILQRYQRMYDVFFEERVLIPNERFYELAFEDLQRDPIGQTQSIYQRLEIKGFNDLRSILGDYVTAQSTYQKNEFPELPLSLKTRIATTWQRCFQEWDYAP